MSKIGIILSSTRDNRFADTPTQWDELAWWAQALEAARER